MLADRIIFVCAIVLAGVYFWATAQIPSLEIGDPLGPKVFPRLLGVGLLVAAVMLLLEMRRGTPRVESAEEAGDRRHFPMIAAVVTWTFLYFITFERIGFLIGTTIYLFVLMAYFHRGRWRTNVLTSVLFAACAYLLFSRLLDVNLPRGVLPF
jgi:putative tricarboxylic transport membrane protein